MVIWPSGMKREVAHQRVLHGGLQLGLLRPPWTGMHPALLCWLPALPIQPPCTLAQPAGLLRPTAPAHIERV